MALSLSVAPWGSQYLSAPRTPQLTTHLHTAIALAAPSAQGQGMQRGFRYPVVRCPTCPALRPNPSQAWCPSTIPATGSSYTCGTLRRGWLTHLRYKGLGTKPRYCVDEKSRKCLSPLVTAPHLPFLQSPSVCMGQGRELSNSLDLNSIPLTS